MIRARHRILFALLLPTTVASCGTEGEETKEGCLACDLTGTWVGRYQSLEHDTDGGFIAELVQKGTAITGSFTSQYLGLDDAPVSGTVRGGAISLSSDDGDEISFSGTLAEDHTASGSYRVPSESDRGEWHAALAERGALTPEECFEVDDGIGALAHDGTNLWYSTSGPSLFLSTPDGEVQAEREPPDDPCKMDFARGSLWLASWEKIYQMDKSGNVQSEHPFTAGEGLLVGLAAVDEEMWVATDTIYRLDSEFGGATPLDTALLHPGAMVYDGTWVWTLENNNLPTIAIFGLDLQGNARAYYDLPSDFNVTDIAFDGTSLWVSQDPRPFSQSPSRICRMSRE